MKYINIDISNHPHSRKFKIKKIVKETRKNNITSELSFPNMIA